MNDLALSSLRKYVDSMAALRNRKEGIENSCLDSKLLPDPSASLKETKGLEHLYIDFNKINRNHKLKGKIGYCYKYAYRSKLEHDNLVYCEGYAVPNGVHLPLPHAWCVDKNTHEVFDPVWKNKKAGVAYCGLPLNMQFVNAVMVESGIYGVLDSLWYVYRKLNNFLLKDVVHEDFHNLVFAKSV